MRPESRRRRFFFAIMVFSLMFIAPAAGRPAEQGVSANAVPALACPPCDDANACTVDTCDTTTGACLHAQLQCDDANPCTSDTCDAQTGCVYSPLPAGTACDDQNACTAGDTCDENARCAGAPEPAGTGCDDGNSCTLADQCDGAGQCAGLPQAPGSPCDDGQACTLGDACVQDPATGITCKGTPRVCDDGNICTDDSCDPATGQCTTKQINCSDDTDCTYDFRDPIVGCRHASREGEYCSDFNVCTQVDKNYCIDNRLVCLGSQPRDCNDDNHCTTDACDPSRGCVHTPTSCD